MTWKPAVDGKGNRVPGLRIYAKSGIYYVKKKFGRIGVPPLEASTGEMTLGRAKTKAEALELEWKNKHLGISQISSMGRRSGKTVNEIIDYVLANHTPKQRPATRAKHELIFGYLADHIGNRDVSMINERTLDEIIASVTRSDSTRKTFMDFAKHLNLLMRTAYRLKSTSHLISFSNPDKGKKTKWKVYTDAEVTDLWAKMNDDLKDQFVLSYECMMRLREVLKLEWSRVDLETGKITLGAKDVKTGTKTGKGREFYMSEHALCRLRARKARAKKPFSPYVFPSPANKLKPVDQNKTAWVKAKTDAKIVGTATWHSLRHSAITKALLEAKIPPVEVSEYAGVSIATIQRVYLHSRPEHTANVAKAISIFTARESGGNEVLNKQ